MRPYLAIDPSPVPKTVTPPTIILVPPPSFPRKRESTSLPFPIIPTKSLPPTRHSGESRNPEIPNAKQRT